MLLEPAKPVLSWQDDCPTKVTAGSSWLLLTSAEGVQLRIHGSKAIREMAKLLKDGFELINSHSHCDLAGQVGSRRLTLLHGGCTDWATLVDNNRTDFVLKPETIQELFNWLNCASGDTVEGELQVTTSPAGVTISHGDTETSVTFDPGWVEELQGLLRACIASLDPVFSGDKASGSRYAGVRNEKIVLEPNGGWYGIAFFSDDEMVWQLAASQSELAILEHQIGEAMTARQTAAE